MQHKKSNAESQMHKLKAGEGEAKQKQFSRIWDDDNLILRTEMSFINHKHHLNELDAV